MLQHLWACIATHCRHDDRQRHVERRSSTLKLDLTAAYQLLLELRESLHRNEAGLRSAGANDFLALFQLLEGRRALRWIQTNPRFTGVVENHFTAKFDERRQTNGWIRI